MDDGELPAMIEMVKKGRGNRVERFAVKLVLGEHLARPCLLRNPAGLCYHECKDRKRLCGSGQLLASTERMQLGAVTSLPLLCHTLAVSSRRQGGEPPVHGEHIGPHPTHAARVGCVTLASWEVPGREAMSYSSGTDAVSCRPHPGVRRAEGQQAAGAVRWPCGQLMYAALLHAKT